MHCYGEGTDVCYQHIVDTNSTWDDTGFLFFVMFSGIFGGFWLLSMIFKVNKVDDESESEDDVVPYEEMYVSDIREALENPCEIDDEKLKALELSNVSDFTPRGMVTMLYSKDTESFWWFSDKKDIPFSHLETVARKYVSVFDCPQLYVSKLPEFSDDSDYSSDSDDSGSDAGSDTGSESVTTDGDEGTDSNSKSQSDNTESNDGEKPSVFVKLRKFENENTDHSNVDVSKSELCNRFSYRGKLADFKELQKAREAVYIPQESDKNMSFEDFKKLEKSTGESVTL